ncbi:hypothetical protein ALI22I_25995 [Saccharothrix sp. ALI-22-I]|uniref:hypothetical protein n=1 Tax=Saccharothrix sp. ALI-22-I TaxID=1933778 RepID=UPI00097C0C6B|nr:hypothetical protein [Saccharothrix sp. ALI-22-I]ONI86163.1 hypothetical protein ALI22I_25995 [Saccharothrix sp. ALI-22-I]
MTSISAESLSYSVAFPHSGGIQASVGPSLGGGTFGFRDFPAIDVGLLVVDGTSALVLQPGVIP